MRRFLPLFFIVPIFFFLFPSPIHAQTPNPQDAFSAGPLERHQTETKIKEEQQGKDAPIIYSTNVNENAVQDLMYNVSKAIGACFDKADCDEQAKKSALGNVTTLIGEVYSNPAASGIAYVQDTLKNAGIVKPAYAQGIGFSALSTFLPFWKVTRNIAYSVIIIVMLVIGFMIIFRMKIDPKTVITIQAALPKIVVALLLITFSYPIAGFFIDIMYFAMAIVISLVVNGAGGTIGGATVTNLQSTYLNANIGDLFGAVFWAGVINNLGMEIASISGVGIVGLITSLIIQTAALTAIATWGGVILLVVFGGFLFTFVRLFFLLLNSYIQLLISVIFAPLILLQEAIPGKSAFGGWIQNLLANLVVFPATAAVLIFAAFLGGTDQASTSTWSPPFVGVGAGGTFHYILSIGVVFLAPNLVAAAKKAFNPQPILPFSVGTIFAPLTGTVQTGMSAMQTQYYFQQATQHGPLRAFMDKLGGGGKGGGHASGH